MAVSAPSAAQIAEQDAIELVAPHDTNSDAIATTWNGRSVAFVEHVQIAANEELRLLDMVFRDDRGNLTSARVTTVEEEGGLPEIAAIGFANADHDRLKELLVLLTWPQRHFDYEGAFYEVRVFDDFKPGQAALVAMDDVSSHFDLGCDCVWRDGTRKRYRYKTISAVRAELRRMGF